MRTSRVLTFAALLFFSALPARVFAGMPSMRLSDFGVLRLTAISFFLLLLLLSAGGVQLLWNWLARDFKWLPRLNYWRACGVVMLWGLLFVVVLTMISGARELMTPGAWVKRGFTYRLASADVPQDANVATPAAAVSEDKERLAERRLKLAELRHALDQFAAQHEGNYPASRDVPEIAAALWELPGGGGLRYVYVPQRTAADRDLPLAFEPEFYSGDPLTLLVGGEIERLARERIDESLAVTGGEK